MVIMMTGGLSLWHGVSDPLWDSTVCADIPHLIRYQGQAVDSQGVPLEGPYTLTFRLYDAQTAGTKVWEEIQANVVLQGGHFSVLLGQVTPLTTIDWSQSRWVSIQVGQDPELAPRQRITSVPLAIRSEKAETAERLAVPVTTSTITDDANRLIPAGAIILWDGASCPAGYTRLASYDDKFLVSSSTAGTTGGSNSHSHGAGSYAGPSHTHTGPSHTHGFTTGGNNVNNPSTVVDGTGEARSGHVHSGTTHADGTGATGSGGTGSITGTSSSADNRPAFKTVLLCKKD